MSEAQSSAAQSEDSPAGFANADCPTRGEARGWTTLAVIAAAALLLLFRLSAIDLWAPDEPRYAQVAEEMRALERGPADLVLLRLNGQPYTQKPPLYYWLAAAAGAPSGRVSEWAARAPSALAGIALVWLTLRLGQTLFRSRAAGLWSAAVLLTSFRFAHLARRAQLDVLLALFETTALFAFWRLEVASRGEPTSRRSHRATLVLMHAALGCAVLTKGPVGLLPLAVMGAYLAWEGRFRAMRRLLPPWSLLLSLGPALLWLAGSVSLAPEGFFDDAVVENLFSRFFTGTSHARPFYYYAYQFPADFLPWTLLWPLAGACAVRQLWGREAATSSESARVDAAAWRFALAWLAVSVVFFSLSAGKRGLYLLPAFPAAAIACGAALAAVLARRREAPRWLARVAVAVAVGLVAAGAVLGLAFDPALELERWPGFPVPRSFGFALLATGSGVALLLWRGRTEGGARAFRRPSRAAIAAAGILAAYGIELALFSLVYPAFDTQKSLRPIAAALATASQSDQSDQSGQPERAVGVFQYRSMIGGLRYYGAREVVNLDGVEAVEAFLQSGGGAIAARARHRNALQAAAPLELRDSLRRGSRQILILAPASGVSGGLAPPPGAEAPDSNGDSP